MNTNYFWLNCGYNRFNHFEDLMGQVSVFDSTVHFNPSEGYTAFKRARVGDKVIFYQVQNKIGLLGAGTVVKYEEPKRGQIKIHFRYDEKLKNLTKDYLERSEQLKNMLFKMKEQLLNPISKEDYELIMNVGRGEEKINRYFLMKENEKFEPGKEYTIFVRTINGFERNGFKNYREMQAGDQAIIYRTTPERGVYGTAQIIESMHRKPIIPGRTDTAAITIKYTGDIQPRSIYDLDREPMLRGQYFIGEEWNESVTELTKLQYEVMLEPNIDEETQEPVKTTTYLDELIRQASKPKTKPVKPQTKTFITPSGRKYTEPPLEYKIKPKQQAITEQHNEQHVQEQPQDPVREPIQEPSHRPLQETLQPELSDHNETEEKQETEVIYKATAQETSNIDNIESKENIGNNVGEIEEVKETDENHTSEHPVETETVIYRAPGATHETAAQDQGDEEQEQQYVEQHERQQVETASTIEHHHTIAPEADIDAQPKQHDKILHIFIVTNQHDPYFTVKKFMQLKDNTPYYIADKNWTLGTMYGQYVTEGEEVRLHEGILTKSLEQPIVIEDIDRLCASVFKPLVHAAEGHTIELGYEKYGKPATFGEQGTYKPRNEFKIIGITTKPIETIAAQFPEYMHGQIKVYQFK